MYAWHDRAYIKVRMLRNDLLVLSYIIHWYKDMKVAVDAAATDLTNYLLHSRSIKDNCIPLTAGIVIFAFTRQGFGLQ